LNPTPLTTGAHTFEFGDIHNEALHIVLTTGVALGIASSGGGRHVGDPADESLRAPGKAAGWHPAPGAEAQKLNPRTAMCKTTQ